MVLYAVLLMLFDKIIISNLFYNYFHLFPSLVTYVGAAPMDRGSYLIPKTEITAPEKTKIIIKEEKVQQEEAWPEPEILSPKTFTDRDDNWFKLLDVIHRQTYSVSPGTG